MEGKRTLQINIPIPRIRAKVSTIRIHESVLQRRVKNVLRKSRATSQIYLHYHAPKLKHPLHVDVIKKEEYLLPYTRYIKEQDKIINKHKRYVSLQQKYKMTLSQYRNRLYIEDPPDDVKALTDIDKDFFKYVNGRCITNHISHYKSLKAIINNLLLTKLEVGYRRECLLNIEINHKNEINVYKKSYNLFTKQTKCLDTFISEDYKKSLELLQKCDAFYNEVNIKRAELELIANHQCRIVSSLLRLDYMYYIQQTYGRFLYYLSPPSWRASNRNFAKSMEIELKGFDLGMGGDKTFSDVFDKMQKECLSDLVSPALYFTEPNQLIQLFEFIGNQQISCLKNTGILTPLITQEIEEINFLKDIIIQESASLLDTIIHIKTLLEESEERCSFLENKFYKIANGFFYDVTGGSEVMTLTSHLEFVYKEIFLEEPINVDIVIMAKNIESFYLYYCDHLDLLLHVNIKDAVRQTVEIEHKKMRRAKQARKDLCTFDIMKKKMLKAFEPPPLQKPNYHNEIRKVGKDVKVPVLNPHKPMMSKNQMKNVITEKTSLTETELEYLTLFTNWCPDEDPDKYMPLK